MPRFYDYVPEVVIPAALLALQDDFSSEKPGTRRHLRDVAVTLGLSAITVNGPASEAAVLNAIESHSKEARICGVGAGRWADLMQK